MASGQMLEDTAPKELKFPDRHIKWQIQMKRVGACSLAEPLTNPTRSWVYFATEAGEPGVCSEEQKVLLVAHCELRSRSLKRPHLCQCQPFVDCFVCLGGKSPSVAHPSPKLLVSSDPLPQSLQHLGLQVCITVLTHPHSSGMLSETTQ